MRHFMVYIKDELDKNDFHEFYADILKRLDDAQDQIRIECCKTLEVMFDLLPEHWAPQVVSNAQEITEALNSFWQNP